MLMIRKATREDAERLLEIYAYCVENTAITFEYDVPSLEEFNDRIDRTLKEYPYLVLQEDEVIHGYAYAGAFVGRAAYRHSCETTIYLDHDSKGRGYGRRLYAALEQALKDIGILNMYACIADPVEEDGYLTRDSEQFHHHLGFTKVGTFHKCGYKFDRWYNIIWMEKIIGEHD